MGMSSYRQRGASHRGFGVKLAEVIFLAALALALTLAPIALSLWQSG